MDSDWLPIILLFLSHRYILKVTQTIPFCYLIQIKIWSNKAWFVSRVKFGFKWNKRTVLLLWKEMEIILKCQTVLRSNLNRERRRFLRTCNILLCLYWLHFSFMNNREHFSMQHNSSAQFHPKILLRAMFKLANHLQFRCLLIKRKIHSP